MQSSNKKILKFYHLKDNNFNYVQPTDLKKIAWIKNVSSEKMRNEIQKMCGIDPNQDCNMIVMDSDECAFILNYDMEFD
jgi:hypothetical protein